MKLKSIITQQIIKNLKTAGSWQQEWQDFFAVNLINKKQYHGINRILLSFATSKYKDNRFLTFNQVKKKNGFVKKKEKGFMVVYYNHEVNLKEKNCKNCKKRVSCKFFDSESIYPCNEYKGYSFLNYYYVWNIQQTTLNIPLSNKKVQGNIDCLEKIINNSGARIETGESPAYYPDKDTIVIPNKEVFNDLESWYTTVFHELVHWTGHEKRLNRKKENNKKGYAIEELIAELGSAFILADHGVKHNIKNITSYIKSWLCYLESDNKFIFTAAAEAEKAVKFLKEKKKAAISIAA